jgi:hypothetical protein
MTIAKLEDPTGGAELVEKYLGEILAHDQTPLGGARNKRRTKALAPSVPLPVYTINVSEVSGPNFLSNAVQTGWRYFVQDADQAVLADLDIDEKGKNVFAGVTRGPFAERLVSAAMQAEKLFGASSDEFAPRILEIPPLYLVAFWMHEVHSDVAKNQFGKDRFIPALEGPAKVVPSADDTAKFASRVMLLASKKSAATLPKRSRSVPLEQ